MELTIIVTFLLTIILFGLQMTFFKKKILIYTKLTLIAIGIYLIYPHCIEQSYKTIQQAINNTQLINNFATIITAEALIGTLLSILQIKLLFAKKHSKIAKYSPYFSGITILIAIFYIESFLFINIRNINFQILAITFAITIPLFLLGLTFILNKLIPEHEIRIELKFFLHIGQIVTTIILTITTLKLPVKIPKQNHQLYPFLTIILISLIISLSGYLIHQIKIKKTWK